MEKTRNAEGFTLVEIALALLVVAIGAVSIMGLFPAGLQSNKRALDETRVAMFAEDVLGGVKTVIEATPWHLVEDKLQFIGVPTVAPDLFANNTIRADGNEGKYRYAYGTSESILDAGSVRYKLDVDVISVNRYGITLQVWPNEFGQDEDGFVFYTEAYYHGRHN